MFNLEFNFIYLLNYFIILKKKKKEQMIFKYYINIVINGKCIVWLYVLYIVNMKRQVKYKDCIM